MADIELVIKIPEEVKNRLWFGITYSEDIQVMLGALSNGTPLPKRHGRLIEVNEKLYQEIRKWVGVGRAFELLDNAPTIIEADKESEE